MSADANIPAVPGLDWARRNLPYIQAMTMQGKW